MADHAPLLGSGPREFAQRVLDGPELRQIGLGLSREGVEQFLIAAYNASLLQEEGRSLRFQACLVAPDNIPGLPRLEFVKAEPLRAELLRRLGPSLPPSPFAFLVVDARSGGPQLLGWTRIERRRFSLTVELTGSPVEGGLWVRVIGPGVLEVWSSHFVPSGDVLRLAQGVWTVARVDLPLGLHFFGFLNNAASRFLLHIVPDACELGHGGTFMMVDPPTDPADLWYPTGRLQDGRRCSTPNLAVSLRELEAVAVEHREQPMQRVLDAARCLTLASAVDGAVVITEDLRLIAFGCELRTPEGEAEPRHLGPDRAPLEASAIRSGMRHKSAARFCAHVPGARAIVISQDAEIRLFRHAGPGEVLVQGPFIRPVPHRLYGTYD